MGDTMREAKPAAAQGESVDWSEVRQLLVRCRNMLSHPPHWFAEETHRASREALHLEVTVQLASQFGVWVTDQQEHVALPGVPEPDGTFVVYDKTYPHYGPDAVRAYGQQCHEAGRQLGMEQANALWQMAKDAEEKGLHERVPLSDAQVDDIVIKAAQQWARQTSPHPSKSVITARLLEAAHGITPTQQAGDSDKPRHVCGAQGFGALGDVCPACEQRDTKEN